MENVSFFISKNNTPTAYAKLEIRVIPSGRVPVAHAKTERESKGGYAIVQIVVRD
jgi:hypothetical protein